MSDFVLPLFPFDSSALTVTTTVWIGVMVGAFFNLRFGWTLSGLVVPGYLTPLLMTRPLSVAVITFESILVYAIVVACSEWPRGLRYWSSFFGRDRFFFILLVSVLVRALLDGFLLPIAGEVIVSRYGLDFDYQNDLHSFGLIIVALIANYFWKPGVVRGLPPLMTCVGATYFLVTWVLVPYTNFSVGNLYLLYEDITSSLLASPKAYILVITTAYLASWINLRYAWDFNGILVPALLGLLWYEPAKIVVSGFECIIVLLAGQWIMKLPIFQGATIEGARKLSFFFTVCFLYRVVLCHLLPAIWPNVQLTDAFGYGYLLTTLMAVKIHDKKRPISMLIGTVHVSLAGAVAGSLIGFALLCSPRMDLMSMITHGSDDDQRAEPVLEVSAQGLMDQLRADRVLLYEKKRPESYRIPSADELAAFRSALEQLKTWTLSGASPQVRSVELDSIVKQMSELNYRISLVERKYLYLTERSPTAGWGIYVVDLDPETSLGVQVPAPLLEWATLDCGVRAMQLTGARSLSVAGAKRNTNLDGSSDVLRVRETMFSVFQQVFADQDLLQIRGYTQSGYRRIADSEGLDRLELMDLGDVQSRMYVHRGIPDGMSLAMLRTAAAPFEIRWQSSPLANVLRDQSSGRVLEWFLSRSDRRQLVGSVGYFGNGDEAIDQPASNVGGSEDVAARIHRMPLRSYLQTAKARILPKSSQQFRPATVDEMLFMAQEVISPTLKVASEERAIDHHGEMNLSESAWAEIAAINSAAGGLGYRLDVVSDPYTKDVMLVLVEDDANVRRGWGTYVFRIGMVDSVAIEIPRPLLERYSIDFGINLFEHPRGSVLSLAGAHPHANSDHRADISLSRNRTSLFNLVRHELLRHLGDRPFLIVQARAITAPVQADIVVACDDGAKKIDQLSPLKRLLLGQLATDDQTIALVGGQIDTAGYEIGMLLQATTTQSARNKEAISLWLSPSLRRRFSDEASNDSSADQFDVCGIESIQVDLASDIARRFQRESRSASLDVEFVRDLLTFTRTNDVVLLHGLVARYPQYRLRRVIDQVSGQAFLCIETGRDAAPDIVNLTGAISNRIAFEPKVDESRIRYFARSKTRWLRFGAESGDAGELRDFVSLPGVGIAPVTQPMQGEGVR
ncbi:MAG: hypothetical protein KDB00_01190 [Planctomycetales bacterium]|nr:hypothetical protein [Planctomycetales bacterium]